MADNRVISDADIKQMSDEELIDLVKNSLAGFKDIELNDEKIKQKIRKVKKFRNTKKNFPVM